MECQHETCACEAPQGERWCSEACREAASRARRDEACECGHADCDEEGG
jgi:predicted nucleic acid-binding Zn ribbon protein